MPCRASHTIIRDPIRQSVICLQEKHNTSSESTTLSALQKPHSCDLQVKQRTHSVRAEAPNPNGYVPQHIAKVERITTTNRLSGSTTLQGNITSQFNFRSQTDTAIDVTAAYRRNRRTHKRVIMIGKSSLAKKKNEHNSGCRHYSFSQTTLKKKRAQYLLFYSNLQH